MQQTRQVELAENIRREAPHLSEQDVAVLTEIVARLVDAYEPLRIYLFGSKARGDFGPDSDFDVMVIVPDNAEGDRRDSKLARQVLWGVGTAKDVLVNTSSRFDSRTRLRVSLPGTILREGKLLYAA